MTNSLPNEYRRGYARFLGCKIDLSKRVLIPRPETAFWVRKAIGLIRKNKKPVDVLDVFSGSGCIGLALLKNCPEYCRKVDFLDKEAGAVSQIKLNLKMAKIPAEKFRVIKSDVFSALKKEKYDYILANPPYVASERIGQVQPSVLEHEPKTALLAGKKGLIYVKKFLRQAKNFLAPGGIIFMEHDPFQTEDIEKIIEKEKYGCHKFRKDGFGRYRFVQIRRNC